jgi:cytochrome c-type biogenesis protein CcmE
MATWEKTTEQAPRTGNRLKFLVAGGITLSAVVFLIVSGTTSGARYFITIESLLNDSTYVGQTVRITGAVVGETIEYDSENLIIDFAVAHVPEETDDLAHELYLAANNPDSLRIPVHIENEVKPDLLQHEAQAILTGELGEDGVFYASELLLKCPSRYDEALPNQSAASVNSG